MSDRFLLYLVKPSHYDDDGYVIQWVRSAIPSNTLAVLHGLAADCRARHALGGDVEIEIRRLTKPTRASGRSAWRARSRQGGGRGLVGLVGVQSNQFPHAIDLARRLRATACRSPIGGFHVSGCLAMLPEMPGDLARGAGARRLAVRRRGRRAASTTVLQDAYAGKLKPLYNFMNDLPGLEGAPMPMLPAASVMRTAGVVTSFDAGRGCPFQCSFCTIINVQGRKSRYRSPDDVEAIIRANLAQGIDHFFITDDNLARNRNWEPIFDRLIAMRRGEGLDFNFVIQVDTLCHRIPAFHREGGARPACGGCSSASKTSIRTAWSARRRSRTASPNIARCCWSGRRSAASPMPAISSVFPPTRRRRIVRDIKIIQRELPLDLLEFFCLTPLPGSEDHKKLAAAGSPMDPDMNKYDLEHVVTGHPQDVEARVGARLSARPGRPITRPSTWRP